MNSPQAHVQAMVKKGELISLKRGLFETDVNTPGFVLANSICFGVFTYRDVSENVFPYYYTRELSGDRPYLIASREKALCDQLSTISPIRGINDFREYLFDGMRLDEDIFEELDFTKIRRIAPMYHRGSMSFIKRVITNILKSRVTTSKCMLIVGVRQAGKSTLVKHEFTDYNQTNNYL